MSFAGSTGELLFVDTRDVENYGNLEINWWIRPLNETLLSNSCVFLTEGQRPCPRHHVVWEQKGPQGPTGEFQRGDWILLDYLDCVLHVFTPEARVFYRLEQLWGQVPQRQVV